MAKKKKDFNYKRLTIILLILLIGIPCGLFYTLNKKAPKEQEETTPNFFFFFHTKKLTWYENISHSSLITKQKEIWMMNTSDKSLLSFTRQNPLKILLKLKKNDIPDRSRATTFRLGGKPSIQIRYRYNIFGFIIFINSSTKTS